MRALLMGGQACILYGAAEFSRDMDFAVLCDPQNLQRLRAALKELRAQPVSLPPLAEKYLLRGHACHFRCRARGAERLRVDVMSVMRGCDPFPALWQRRTRLLQSVLIGDVRKVQRELGKEEAREREADRHYWLPLRHELATLRRKKPKGN